MDFAIALPKPPLWMKRGSEALSDSQKLGTAIVEFKQSSSLTVADSAFYTQDNWQIVVRCGL
ncbi:hypothetical protein CKA32_004131 [Geitlerinema sp. FC II]|nr:hypothetical protein CKA32_004131 [Geitlerinema sp. FC II]